MLTIIIKDNSKTIFEKSFDEYDEYTITALIEEIQKSMSIGQMYLKVKNEMNPEAVKQMIEGWK